ncbi:MAG: hypothetical protein FK730_13140 [Asgard group archaeon]|nr:hypothetical protein [Asgard group archaeon]
MVTDEQLIISSEISATLINKAALEQSYPRRLNEQIKRAEAKKLKKKLDTITLAIVIGLTIIVGIIFILEIQLDIFVDETDKIYIPIILLSILVIVSVLLAIEFYLVKNKGEERLNQKLGLLSNIDKKIMELQKRNTLVYNYVKNAFTSVSKVDSKYLLNGLVIRYYVYLTDKEHEYSVDTLYRYLFLVSTKKNLIFNKLVKNKEEIEEIKSNIFIHLPNLELILTKFKEMDFLPNFFILSAMKSLELINQFKITKGDFLIKKGKIIKDKEKNN